ISTTWHILFLRADSQPSLPTDTQWHRDSNVYKRGQLINLQVSARTRPGQQLFIQSCYVSVSPEPQTRPRQAIIMNKGCSVPVGSPPAAVQFVAPDKDVVNFVLNTSSLIPELFIHCSVIRSDQGVSPGSKSCNYNAIQMRWEELSGTMEECECCSSKCKGPSIKHLPEGQCFLLLKAIVTTGPLVIVDHDIETRSEPLVFHSSKDPITDSMQSDGAAIEDTIDSGSPISRGEFPSPPQGVVVESRDPFTRLTLWLPGQVQGTERQEDGSDSDDNLGVKLDVSDAVFNFLPGVQHSIGSQESRLDPDTNQIRADTLNVPTLTDWTVLSDPEKAPIIRDSHINKIFLARFGQLGKDAPQEADISVPAEMTLNVLNQDGFSQLKEELAATHRLGTNDAGPLIRSKLEFSKGSDGSQTLSYEEEVEREWEGEKGMSRCGARREPELRRKGLRSAFLDLLR
uniref:ZP domain-containing protein n=1 Tax=Mola mola TaxID=94237 RepID=A0A3Q3W3G3_MOLML